MMLIIHTIMRCYDRNWTSDPTAIMNARVSALVLLFLVLFLGGWCGFFLLMSSIGTSISMQKALLAGKSVKQVILKQMVGGAILLLFALLSESLIGYGGWFNHLVFGGIRPALDFLDRAFHMETIHAVAWCVIVNSAVHDLVCRRYGFLKYRRNLVIYGILVIVVLVLTKPVWISADKILPGYPFGTYLNSGQLLQYPLIGEISVGRYFLLFFLMPLAGQVEPIFPFLAVSFIGSIIGIILTMPRVPYNFPRKSIFLSIGSIIIGLFGMVYMFATGRESLDNFIGNTYNIPHLSSWFWWFLLLTGCQVFVTAIFLRVIEFRGKASAFARKTLYFRRFGFVPFSIYNFQYLDFIPRTLVSIIFGIDAVHHSVSGVYTLLLIFGVLFTWHGVLWLWEHIGFFGSLEWIISILSNILFRPSIPPKSVIISEIQSSGFTRKHWWQSDRLNVQKNLRNALWIEIIPADEVDHLGKRDSKLSFKLAFLGFISIVFAYAALDIAIESQLIEGKNRYNQWGKWLGVAGLVFFLTWFIGLTFISGLAI